MVSGSVSALNYANKLNGLIIGVIVSVITTAVFPLLFKESNSDNISGMKNGVNLTLLIIMPTTAGLIVLAKSIVAVD